jgi:hypothetical protein
VADGFGALKKKEGAMAKELTIAPSGQVRSEYLGKI